MNTKKATKATIWIRSPIRGPKKASPQLDRQRTWELLRKVDFSVFSEFHLSPIQLGAAYSFQSAALCAEQALRCRDLITTVFEEACERNKEGKR